MAISDIEERRGTYRLYDGQGDKLCDISESTAGELCGMGLEFAVFLKNGSYNLFDESGRKFGSFSASSVGDFRNANGNTIVFEKNNTVRTFNALTGKAIASRSA